MGERDDLRTLFCELTTAEALGELVRDPHDAARIADELVALRSADVEIHTLSVNNERVDVIARADGREWRVVFATADGKRVDWLNAYERPPLFEGVSRGRAVIVNGPSSSGKSSVVAQICMRGAVPWVGFDEPMFGEVRVGYLIWRERADVLHRGFLEGIAALSRCGNCVAVAAGGHPQSMFDDAFVGIPTLRVGLDCDLAELSRRERGRRDVPGGLAESSLEVHAGWQYDVRFDTGRTSAGDIADAVLEAVAAIAEAQA